jgi:hypothetical protein
MSIPLEKRPASAVLAGTVPVVLLASSLLASGCADNIAYTRLNAPPRPLARRPVAAVEVFALRPPQRRYTDVGLIQVIGANPPPSKHLDIGLTEAEPVTGELEAYGMIGVLRERAAEIGCDAIVVTSIDRKLDYQYWLVQNPSNVPSVQASCVVYNH